MEGDKGPSSCSEGSSKSVTRLGGFSPQVTPFHSQGSREALLQELKAPSGSEMADLKASNASWSVFVLPEGETFAASAAWSERKTTIISQKKVGWGSEKPILPSVLWYETTNEKIFIRWLGYGKGFGSVSFRVQVGDMRRPASYGRGQLQASAKGIGNQAFEQAVASSKSYGRKIWPAEHVKWRVWESGS
ncbi:hypothetical protein IEQ34_021898 [Dendrobium chrysotoxum]|uniref:Uncharacterized protein n=1 Tax=Dendrobium chrysotoxum TaxID=161865 RepID=A0AAV7FXI7_DENCH|nr:hypothetical protein IEQ34_021898 [Dendrobium chrysotoxum]